MENTLNRTLSNTIKQKILTAVLESAIRSARESRAEFVLYGTLFRWNAVGDGIRLLMGGKDGADYMGIRDDGGEILADWEVDPA